MTPHIVRHAWYSRFAKAAARFSGRPRVFTLAVAMIGVWLVTGPLFRFSDTWQLVINTSTTIVTFLMVFLIQNTQNRDTEAIQVKPVMAACPRCRGCKTGECVASTIAYEGQFSTLSGLGSAERKEPTRCNLSGTPAYDRYTTATYFFGHLRIRLICS